MQYIDMTIAFLDTCLVHIHNRCEVFAEVLAEDVNSAGPICEKSSCTFRASSAQAKRCIQLEVRNGTPCSTGLFPPNSRQRKKARKILLEGSVHKTEEKRPTTHIAVKERQRKARQQGSNFSSCSIVQLRLRIRLTVGKLMPWCFCLQVW